MAPKNKSKKSLGSRLKSFGSKIVNKAKSVISGSAVVRGAKAITKAAVKAAPTVSKAISTAKSKVTSASKVGTSGGGTGGGGGGSFGGTGGGTAKQTIGSKIGSALRKAGGAALRTIAKTGLPGAPSSILAGLRGTVPAVKQYAQGVSQRLKQGPSIPGSNLPGPFQRVSPNLPNYSPAPNQSLAPNQSIGQPAITSPQIKKQVFDPAPIQKTAAPVAEETTIQPELSQQFAPPQDEPTMEPIDQNTLDTVSTLTQQGQTPQGIADILNQQSQQAGGEGVFSATDIQGFLEGGQLAGTIPLETEAYTTVSGDTLSKIAAKYGVTTADISGYRSGDPNLIFPGENLTINKGGPSKTNISPASSAPSETLPEETPLTSNETDYLTYLQEKTYGDIYKTLTEQLGLDGVKDRINEFNEKLEDLRNDRADEEADINNNPWISESLRIKKIQGLAGKYDQKEGNMLASLKEMQDLYDDSRQEAQFAAKMYIDKQTEDRNFYYKAKQDTQDYALQIAKFKYDQQQDRLDRAFQEKKFAADQAGGGPGISGFPGEFAPGATVGLEGSPTQNVADAIRGLGFKPNQQTTDAVNVLSSLEQFAQSNTSGSFPGLNPVIRAPGFLAGPEARANRSAINAINLKVQQWASGAALTDAQTRQVEKITPDKNDTDQQVKDKVNALSNFMLGQVRGQFAGQGKNYQPPTVSFWSGGGEEYEIID